MQDFKKLSIWQKAHILTINVYKLTIDFPKEKLYGLTSQIRRASASVPANIAEGCGRGGRVEFGRFIQIALGSMYELEYHLILAHDLKYLSAIDYEKTNEQVTELRKMFYSFKQKLIESELTENSKL